jgi:hypothetical protein
MYVYRHTDDAHTHTDDAGINQTLIGLHGSKCILEAQTCETLGFTCMYVCIHKYTHTHIHTYKDRDSHPQKKTPLHRAAAAGHAAVCQVCINITHMPGMRMHTLNVRTFFGVCLTRLSVCDALVYVYTLTLLRQRWRTYIP